MAEQGGSVGAYERQQIMPAWEAMISDVMARRLGVDPEVDPRPGIAAAVGIAVVGRAKQRWLQAGEDARLGDFFDEAFAALVSVTRELGE